MIKILFLAANPTDTSHRRLDEEMRAIDGAIRAGQYPDELDLRSHWAVRTADLQELLLRHRPEIVHFSGHGSRASEIILQSDAEQSSTVDPAALSELFALLPDSIRCVVLNACYSEIQAAAIARSVDCVVGIDDSSTDQAATQFSTAFYRALSFGLDLRTAFDLGRNQIRLTGLATDAAPQILSHKDLTKLRLVVDPAPVGLIIDVGSVHSPNSAIGVGEVRFSVSNYGDGPIKITSITLRVLARRTSMTSLVKVAAAPVDEYFVFARIDRDSDEFELLDRHHVLNKTETDGFFLKIEASEGFEFDLCMVVTWNHLGIAREVTSTSPSFTVDFGSHSPFALLELIKRQRAAQADLHDGMEG